MEIIQINAILATISINLTNFTEEIIYYSFAPYIDIFGHYFFGIFFGFIGAAVYVASERNYLLTFGYLILTSIFFGIIMPLALVAMIGLISAFIASTVIYRAFVEVRSK